MLISTRFKPNDTVYLLRYSVITRWMTCPECKGRGKGCHYCDDGKVKVRRRVYTGVEARTVTGIRAIIDANEITVEYGLNGGQYYYVDKDNGETTDLIFESEEEANEYRNKIQAE